MLPCKNLFLQTKIPPQPEPHMAPWRSQAVDTGSSCPGVTPITCPCKMGDSPHLTLQTTYALVVTITLGILCTLANFRHFSGLSAYGGFIRVRILFWNSTCCNIRGYWILWAKGGAKISIPIIYTDLFGNLGTIEGWDRPRII